ncbi:MAG: tetratricopeptide repeat protein [Hyellaceae cyanobacterium CSU_1_1]|nr:tetratricopeptide repeat protein [Hyellaceae cyanobacterium CSU_1_1]
MESQSAKIPGSKGLESAESHFHIGIKHSQDGQIELAIASWQTAIALQPNLVEAHYNLGTALLEQGKTEQAIASFQAALDLDPDYH